MTGDTPAGGSEVDEGGPGWGIRQPRTEPDQITHSDRSNAPLPPDHLTPLSATPPTSPQPLSTAPGHGRPLRPLSSAPPKLPALPPLPRPGGSVSSSGRRRNVMIAVIGAFVLFGGAGGAAVLLSGGHTGTAPPSTQGGVIEGGSAANGKAVLTAAVNHFEGTSARADITMTQSFTGTGAGGQDFGDVLGGDITFQVHIDQQSSTRSEMRETITAFGIKRTIIGVQYDNTVYLSTDNGASYQTASIDQANAAQLTPESPLDFFTMLGDVTHTGAVEVNGLTAASYHAVIDPVKLGNYLKTNLAAAHDPDLDKLADNIGVTDATVDAAIDPNGNLISETGVFDTAMDMGAVSPADQGSTLNMKEQINGAFSDYGAPVSIAKPAHVTGAATI